MKQALDIAALLNPIKDDNPVGVELRYSAELAAIEEAIRADPEGAKVQKKADWNEARKVAETALKLKGKDLQIAGYLVQSLYHSEGVEGMSQGLRFLKQFLSKFWDDMYPKPDGEEELERVASFDWLEGMLCEDISMMPLTAPLGTGVSGYDMVHWQQAQDLQHIAEKDPSAIESAEKEGKVSPRKFTAASDETPDEFYETLRPALQECALSLEELKNYTSQLLNGSGPTFEKLRSLLADCNAAVEAIMLSKGLIKPQEIAQIVPGEKDKKHKPGPDPLPPVGSREQALQDLLRIAQFFRTTEPHSPVPYLILRAEKWARMPLDTLLAELIGDNGVLENLKTLLNLRSESAQ